MKRHAAEDPRVRVIDKENGGYGAGCNRDMDEARGEWVSIIEPDDWIEPGMYADMLAFAAQFNQQIDVIKTPWWNINHRDQPSLSSPALYVLLCIEYRAQPSVQLRGAHCS